MISSTPYARVYRLLPATAGRYRWPHPRGWRFWRVWLRLRVDHQRVRSLITRAPGRLTQATAQYWATPMAGFVCPRLQMLEQRARRLARDLHRYKTLQSDIAELDEQITRLLATTDGQVLNQPARCRDHPSRRIRRPQPPHRAIS